MGIALNLMAARQGAAQHTVVMWSGQDATAKSLVLVVARRRLDADELEQAVTGGHVEADRVSVPATAGAVIDDLTAAGEPRYYGVLAVLADGSYKPTRFRAGPMAELPEGSLKYSALGGRSLAASAGAAPVATGAVRGPFAAGTPTPAPQPPPVTGSGPVRGPFAASSPTPAPVPAPTTGSGPVRGPFAASSPTPEPLPAPVTGSGAVRGPFAAHVPTPPPTPAPVTGSGAVRGPFAAAASPAPSAPAPEAAPAIDPMEARRQAQQRAQQAAAAAAAASAPPAPRPEPEAPAAPVDPMEARRQAQARAQQAAAAAAGLAVPSAPAEDPLAARRAAQGRARAQPLETVAPPSDFPVSRFGLRMSGGTQSWDGLRILWEGEGKPASAYEVFVADHPLSPDEVGELLGGASLEGAFVKAFPASIKAVIDNVTARESRGYYAVVARDASGNRALLGCAAQGSDECQLKKAPFFDAAALDEVRSLANGQVREARMQLLIFREDQDVGAWREALRLVGDALAIYPDLPEAIALEQEIKAARQ